MQVEVITRIIFKIPEEGDAAKEMQEQIRSNPNPGVYTRIIRTDNTVEIFMSRCQEGPINRRGTQKPILGALRAHIGIFPIAIIRAMNAQNLAIGGRNDVWICCFYLNEFIAF